MIPGTAAGDVSAARGIAPEPAPAAPFPGGPRLIHGNLDVCHLLVGDRGRVAPVVDWGDLHRGDPALDLSVAFSYLPPRSRRGLFAAHGDVAAADSAQARFGAIHCGALLLVYGRDVGSVVTASRRARKRAVV